jgi:hypothetical protein
MPCKPLLIKKSRMIDDVLSKFPPKQIPVSQPPPPSVKKKFNYELSPEERKMLIAETQRNIIDRFK